MKRKPSNIDWDVWNSVISTTLVEPMKDNEITSKMYANRVGLSERAARARLDKLIDEGKVSKRRAVIRDGVRGNVYTIKPIKSRKAKK